VLWRIGQGREPIEPMKGGFREAPEGPRLLADDATPYALTAGNFDFAMIFQLAKREGAAIGRLPTSNGPITRHGSEADAPAHGIAAQIGGFRMRGLIAELAGRVALIHRSTTHSATPVPGPVDNLWITCG